MKKQNFEILFLNFYLKTTKKETKFPINSKEKGPNQQFPVQN